MSAAEGADRAGVDLAEGAGGGADGTGGIAAWVVGGVEARFLICGAAKGGFVGCDAARGPAAGLIAASAASDGGVGVAVRLGAGAGVGAGAGMAICGGGGGVLDGGLRRATGAGCDGGWRRATGAGAGRVAGLLASARRGARVCPGGRSTGRSATMPGGRRTTRWPGL
jgi:hypothetical protein